VVQSKVFRKCRMNSSLIGEEAKSKMRQRSVR
jgi:hypothetical protein